jgi:hypothetical protein
MDMEWADIGKTIGKAAPLLGNVLTGNIPGAIGTVAGWIGDALGVDPTPDAVSQALKTDPQAAIMLAEIEAKRQTDLAEMGARVDLAEIDADKSQISDVNTTMRAEGASEHWPQWSWRPAIGFAFALGFLACVLFVCVLAWQAVGGGKPDAISMIPTLVSAFAALFAIPGAILGVAAHHRGKQKRGEA